MARQTKGESTNGKGGARITALIVTPDMEGVDIFQKNRSKCGVRGTWQARIRFHEVNVPRDHLLHQEGKGLNVALTCLDYGRCTLSAGMRPLTVASSFTRRRVASWYSFSMALSCSCCDLYSLKRVVNCPKSFCPVEIWL